MCEIHSAALAPALYLRPLTGADIDILFSLTSDPEVARYMRFNTHLSIGEAQALYREYTGGSNRGYIICRTDTQAPVGVAACKADENDPSYHNLSIYLYPRFWSRGYCTQTVKLLQSEASLNRLNHLKAYVVSENTGSCRVLEKTGFVLQEVLYMEDLPSGLRIYTWG